MPRIGRPKRVKRDQHLAYEYARFSTEMQGSIAEQQAINREVAADGGVVIVGSYTDEGVSRSVGDRPGLLAVMQAFVDHPEVGYLVVNELERLTAGIEQRAAITRLCKERNVTILTEDVGAIDPFDESAMIDADEKAVNAQRETAKVRRRTRRNLRQKVIAGTVARRPAYGVRMKPLIGPDGVELPSGVVMVDGRGRKIRSGVLEEHPQELPWLRRIYEWADAGVTNEEIAKRLTSTGVPTKTGNTTWRGNSVAGILANPLYKGQLVWGLHETRRDADGKAYLETREEGDSGIVVLDSPLGALVDPDVWDRLATRREVRLGEHRMARRTFEAQPFDGLVYCRRCERKMYGRNDAAKRGGTIWRYYCTSNRNATDNPELPPRCETVVTMPVRRILQAFDVAGVLAADSPITSPADIPCGLCDVGIGEECVTKAKTPFTRGEDPWTCFHSTRVAAFDGVGDPTGGALTPTTFTFRQSEDDDSLIEKRRLRKEVMRLELQRDHQEDRLLNPGAMRVERIEAALEQTVADLEAARVALAAVDRPQARREDAERVVGGELARLARVLRSDLLPTHDKVAAVAASGIRRLYVDDPLVEVELG